MTRTDQWAVRHRLHTIEVKIHLDAEGDAPGAITVTVTGTSVTKRQRLWCESNVYGPGERWPDGEDVADWLDHVVRIALRDRPNSSERLLFGLTGGLGEQDPLF